MKASQIAKKGISLGIITISLAIIIKVTTWVTTLPKSA
jgi:hypothetical protein